MHFVACVHNVLFQTHVNLDMGGCNRHFKDATVVTIASQKKVFLIMVVRSPAWMFGSSPHAAMKDSPFIHVRSQSPRSPAPQRSLKEHETTGIFCHKRVEARKKVCVCEKGYIKLEV